MPSYTPPLRDMQFVMHELLGVVDELKALPRHAEIDVETINAVIEEGGKFASEVLAPLNAIGDAEGCTLDKATHEVKPPTGFKEAYAQYVAGGWPALSCDPAFGGQGLPHIVNQCMFEMMNSANQAWTMYPGLSHGAYECLHTHGTEEQKRLYLGKLTTGHWTGTMCLTEPQCGTDLGLLRTKAEPQADGTYKLTGNKIFISAGEHDMTENIVHLVLARLPDSPAGSKGISLFVVPKWRVLADGTLGERNAIWCGGLEHKMGIHGNATAQIVLENAEGTLVGEPNKGLPAMFVMMNAARLGVGMQGLGLTEVAYQNAAAYAKERLQMRSLSGPKEKDKPADPIIVHPDVRKMLLTARAYAEGGRALAMYTTLLLDKEIATDDDEERKDCADLVALLTPIVKAFFTDNAWIATSHCLQVFGGQGLPFVLNQCLFEMLNSANQAWTMYPGLSHGAYECLHTHGTEEQKKLYLGKLTSGHWTGTMCLTEPQCGTDLGLLRTKAQPQADGTYKLTGNKIFISAGEQAGDDEILLGEDHGSGPIRKEPHRAPSSAQRRHGRCG